eukprot:GHVH01001965.1.p1 GENE.GHVH01001965.1~~GHVH01001965.1.p1  ORF type:complete len:318 (-),score=41.53 GHVH01001965.1:412-1365(-)
MASMEVLERMGNENVNYFQRAKVPKTVNSPSLNQTAPSGFAHSNHEREVELLSDMFPLVPRSLTISVLHSTKGDVIMGKSLIEQIIYADSSADDTTAENEQRYRKRNRDDSDALQILQARHSDLPPQIVKFIIQQVGIEGNIQIADIALDKIRSEYLDGSLTSARSVAQDSQVPLPIKHSLTINLLKYLDAQADQAGTKNIKIPYEAVMDTLTSFENELNKIKDHNKDSAKSLARCVISQHQQLNALETCRAQLKEEVEQTKRLKDEEERLSSKLKQDCNRLVNAVQVLQARVESNERGDTLFFNRFGGGHPPSACF